MKRIMRMNRQQQMMKTKKDHLSIIKKLFLSFKKTMGARMTDKNIQV